jgi:hypothetical protein
MSTSCVPCATVTVIPAARGKISPTGAVSLGVFRLPTDPLFYADLTLRNVVAGSRYRVTRTDTGAELATGLVSGSGLVDQFISGVACYANPQQVSITVRNASGTPKYKVFNTSAFVQKAGGEAYILQTED